MNYREICKEDDAILAGIIRRNLKAHELDLPGTVYFDANLEHLSEFYLADRAKRFYFIALENETVIGGIGLAEIDFFENCGELQKIYLIDAAKGRGLGTKLIGLIEDKARELGYIRGCIWKPIQILQPQFICTRSAATGRLRNLQQ